ncbi:hypothetical protein RDWZM_007369 [Blomia tropicalis]|uniref:Solute carrier family 25 member 35 n=1 Tax=Blomia tropicalis TaxID=40697 RepID=A0A9Q0M2I2_BLOTA|nr:hypothetical protein RDWZM_007369 [Blomia tropicalis]
MSTLHLKQWEEYILAGLGASLAGVFTNPLEVIKTRIQLQGELQVRGKYTVHYRNVFHAFYTVAKIEGISALQKGLIPAVWVQFVLNGSRLGTYQFLDNHGFTRNKNGEVVVYKSALSGIGAGLLSAFIGNPFQLVKTHLQSMSNANIAVGHQHGHTTMMNGFRSIYSKFGITGLWRGSVASMTRISIAGSFQLTSFIVEVDSWHGNLLSSFIGSCIVGTTMTPFDVLSTRLFNQPVDQKTGKGLLYNGIVDATLKIYRIEGVRGFFKGFTASFIRRSPHTILSLFFWQQSRSIYGTMKRNIGNN